MKNLVSPEALKSGKLLRGKLCCEHQAFFFFLIKFPGLEGPAHGFLWCSKVTQSTAIRKSMLILNYAVHMGFGKACRKTV